jgi:hypothetical protein
MEPCHHVGIITHLSEDACLQITANVLSDMFHRARVSYTVDLNHRPQQCSLYHWELRSIFSLVPVTRIFTTVRAGCLRS